MTPRFIGPAVTLVTLAATGACGSDPYAVTPGGGFDKGISLYENVDTYVGARVADDFPAVAVAIVKDGITVIEAAYGVVRRDAPDRATVDTPMYLSALSMQFTAVAVLLLSERGELALTDRAVDHVPDLPATWEEMTIRHLLTHQSGLSDYLADPAVVLDTAGLTNQMVLDTLAGEPLRFDPGTQVHRSQSGYLVLAEVVEAVSGVSYGTFVQQNIFDPLGMTRSYVVDETSSDVPGRAVGYASLDSIADYEHRTTGAEGIYASVSDMRTWLTSLEDHTLLSAATTEAMLTTDRGGGYGYGWYVGNWNGTPALYESGSLPGFRTFIGTVPEDDLSYVVLASGAYDWALVLPSLILGYELGL